MLDNTAIERWLPVIGWENFYEVSNLGRVRSILRITRNRNGKMIRRQGLILSPSTSGQYKYCSVVLSRDNVHTTKYIHHLVTEAFFGPLPMGQVRLHGPNGKDDNAITNLCYGTQAQNLEDRKRDGTHPQLNITHDKYGHILAAPNLVRLLWETKRHRNCLACHRTGANQSYAKRIGRPFNFILTAAEHYAKIMDAD
jgi:NUMOD4 motif-containing protein/HNH endonuclease